MALDNKVVESVEIKEVPGVRVSLVELQAIKALLEKVESPPGTTKKIRKARRQQAVDALTSWTDTYISRVRG